MKRPHICHACKKPSEYFYKIKKTQRYMRVYECFPKCKKADDLEHAPFHARPQK